MQMQTMVDVSQIVGAVATGASVVLAVGVYISDYLRKQAESLWDLLFDCESDFIQVYREFDQKGMAEIVGQIMSNPTIHQVIARVWDDRQKTHAEITVTLDECEYDMKYAILDSLSRLPGNTLSSVNEKYQLALYKIRPRYPVLYKFLQSVHSVMKYSSGICQKSDVYYTIIREGLLKMKQSGELGKKTSPSGVQAFLYAIIVANLMNLAGQEKLNELFKSLSGLMDIILGNYRRMSPFSLWRSSHSERSTHSEMYDKETISESIKAVINLMKNDLAGKYGEAATLAGQAEALLTLDTKHK